jgi:hypothetical protein
VPPMGGTPHAFSIHLSEMSEFTQRNVSHLALHLHQFVKRRAEAERTVTTPRESSNIDSYSEV